MKESQPKKIISKDRERCWSIVKDQPLSDFEVIANFAFPPGTLPGESTPPSWTERELAIIRAFGWMTDELEQRLSDARFGPAKKWERHSRGSDLL